MNCGLQETRPASCKCYDLWVASDKTCELQVYMTCGLHETRLESCKSKDLQGATIKSC